MNVMYGYRPYQAGRVGKFRITTDKYGLNGWGHRIDKETIIGETQDWYVIRLLHTKQREWVGEKVIETKMILPIGIHKSRLVSWVGGQLELF